MGLPAVLICGTGDTATACALRLFRAGFDCVVLAANVPYDLHHHRTFTRAVHAGQKSIDSVRARTWSNALGQNELPLKSTLSEFIRYSLLNHEIPIVLENDVPRGFKFPVKFVVATDAQLIKAAKPHLDESTILIVLQGLEDEEAHYRIAVDPLFLGRVIYPFNEDSFTANANESENQPLFLKAPQDGIFQATKEIGQLIFKGDEVGFIDRALLHSPQEGVISGQLNSGIYVHAGQPVVEISRRKESDGLHILPARSFALAGGVLEALMYHWQHIS